MLHLLILFLKGWIESLPNNNSGGNLCWEGRAGHPFTEGMAI